MENMKATVTIEFNVYGDTEQELIEKAKKFVKELDERKDNRAKLVDVWKHNKGIGNNKKIYSYEA